MAKIDSFILLIAFAGLCGVFYGNYVTVYVAQTNMTSVQVLCHVLYCMYDALYIPFHSCQCNLGSPDTCVNATFIF